MDLLRNSDDVNTTLPTQSASFAPFQLFLTFFLLHSTETERTGTKRLDTAPGPAQAQHADVRLGRDTVLSRFTLHLVPGHRLE